MGEEAARPSAAGIAAAFGLRGRVGSLEPVAGAWSNRVYRLEVGGTPYAVKELCNPWGLTTWLDRVDEAWALEQRAIAAGVRAPEPVPVPASGSYRADVERVGQGSGAVAAVRVHRWVEGAAVPDAPAPEEVARWCGGALATIHGLALWPRRPEVFPVRDGRNARRWPELADRAEQARVPWAALARGVTPAIERVAELHAARVDAPTCMGHRDIDQKNLLLTGAGPVLCDWDVAGPVDPRAELADVAVSMARWERWDLARAAIEAYEDAGGEVVMVKPADLAPMLLSGLDWLVLNVERALGLTGSPVDHDLGARLVPGLLERLPGRLALAERIDTFLAR